MHFYYILCHNGNRIAIFTRTKQYFCRKLFVHWSQSNEKSGLKLFFCASRIWFFIFYFPSFFFCRSCCWPCFLLLFGSQQLFFGGASYSIIFVLCIFVFYSLLLDTPVWSFDVGAAGAVVVIIRHVNINASNYKSIRNFDNIRLKRNQSEAYVAKTGARRRSDTCFLSPDSFGNVE